MTASQINKRLREARKAAGLTQVQAGELLGLNPMTISKRERGVLGISAQDFEVVLAVYGKARLNGRLSQPVPHGTKPMAVKETGPDEKWSPNSALKTKIPPRAYETAIEYCRRLARASVPRENIEEAERLMIDSRYAQANKRNGRQLSEDEWIMLVDATWEAIREALSWEGVRV